MATKPIIDGVSQEICEILAHSPHPMKAKELAGILGPKLVRPYDKREVNSVLYGLESYGIVSRDAQFRWSVCPDAIRSEGEVTRFVPTTDPEEKKESEIWVHALSPRLSDTGFSHWEKGPPAIAKCGAWSALYVEPRSVIVFSPMNTFSL